MSRVMYDGITPSAVPEGAPLYAGYVDGHWPSASGLAQRFPSSLIVPIAVSASTDNGVVLDVENGDATPTQSVDWVVMRRSAGVDPTVYMNASTWPAVRAAFKARGITEPYYWVASYGSSDTIPPSAVAVQWKSTAGYDESNVVDYWPGVDTREDEEMPLTQNDLNNIKNIVWSYKNTVVSHDTEDAHQMIKDGAAVLPLIQQLGKSVAALTTAVNNLPAAVAKADIASALS